MPNLVGYWDSNADENEIRKTLDRQLKRVGLEGFTYSKYIAAFDRFGAALLDHGLLENGPQPVYSHNDAITLFMDGEIFNAMQLKKFFRGTLTLDGYSDSRVCLELILKFGDQIVELFNGNFSLVIYDAGRREVKLISDRLGFRPLHFVQRDGRVIFGTELKAVCAADPGAKKIDETGLLELFSYGSAFINRTWMDGYTRLAPATVMTIDEEGINTKTYWNYKYDEDAKTLNQKSYMSIYGTLLDRAVERNMKGTRRIGIFLSGGYDSRAVAASIRKQHLPIPAITFGDGSSRDIRFAAQLAEALGLDHHPLSGQGPYLQDVVRKVVWRTEGLLSFNNNTSIRFHDQIKNKMDIILTGFLGEFSGSHTWSKLLMARSRPDAIKAIYDRMLGGNSTIAKRIFNDRFYAQILEHLRNRFHESFEDVENENPMNIFDSWHFKHVHPQSTYQSPSTDRYQFEARAPMTDRELVNFALTIPPYSRLEHRVYKQVIAYQFPEIRDVPCTNDERPIDPNFYLAYLGMVARFGFRKLSSPFRVLLGADRGLGRDLSSSELEFRAEPLLIDTILRPLIRDGIFPSEIFNLPEIEKIIDEHYNQNKDRSPVLSMLLSWGLASRYFLHDDLSDAPAELFQPQMQ